LSLDRDEAIFVRTAVIRLSSRVVPRVEIQGFREYRSGYREDDECQWGIEMLTLGKPVRFSLTCRTGNGAWLIHQLNLFLGMSGPDKKAHVFQPAVTIPPLPARPQSSTDRPW